MGLEGSCRSADGGDGLLASIGERRGVVAAGGGRQRLRILITACQQLLERVSEICRHSLVQDRVYCTITKKLL